MNRYVERGWRPLLGALAIGLAAFGLSLQGAPAGDGTDLLVVSRGESVDSTAASRSKRRNPVSADVAQSQPQRKMAPTSGQSSQGTEPAAVNVSGGNAPVNVGWVITGTPVLSKGGNAATSRAAGEQALGEICSCDEDCAELGDQCNLTQCIVRGLCSADNATPCSTDGDCTDNGVCNDSPGTAIQRCDKIQLIGWACDADGDFCTLDRCEDDTFGNDHSICVAQNDTSDGSGDPLSPCAKHCVDGPSDGLACSEAGNCAQGSCVIISGGGCDSAAEACFVGGTLGTALGRCCNGNTCTETDSASCGGLWYRYRSVDELVGDGNCLCPNYGSGVAPPGTFNGSSADFGLVRPSGLICQTGSVQTELEVYCEIAGEDAKFCQKRCVGGDNVGQPCVADNPDCAKLGLCSIGNTPCLMENEGSDCGLCSISGEGCDTDGGFFPCGEGAGICEFGGQDCEPTNVGTCSPDTCGPNLNEGSCIDGFLSIGDDYSLKNASFLRLTQFRFRGGTTNLGEGFILEFWDSTGTKLVDQFGSNANPITLPRTGTHDWSIQLDCWPNCNPDLSEVPVQQPVIIPPTGYVVMRAVRTVGTLSGSATFWEQTLNPADVGENFDTKAWVNGPDGSLGTNVFIFELVGTKVPNPLGACCVDAVSCSDTARWDCGFCTITEPQVPCASTLHDCPDALGLNSSCQFNRWFGPVSHDDLEGGANVTVCQGISPCDSGACCDGESCTVQTPTDCLAAGGVPQGIATNCSPNCCPVDNPTGSDCICSTSTCVELEKSCLGGADEGVPCDTAAECIVTDPEDPGTCGFLNTGRLCTSNADCSAVNGECILQCEPNAVTQLRHPHECLDNFDGTLSPRQDCDPGLGAAACPPIPCIVDADCPTIVGSCGFDVPGFCDDTSAMTCVKSINGSFSLVRNDTIAGDLFTVAKGDRCSINTVADRTGWFEQFNLPDPPGGVDDCYILTIGLCCTEPVLTPIWPFLSSYRACPCNETADVIATAPDFDISGDQLDGFSADSKASFAGRCEDGNYSATFTVPPGDYAYQINADTSCSGSIIGCDDDDDCPGSSCNVPNPNYSVVFTTESCQIAACCVDSGCILTNTLDCAAQDGTFLGDGDQPVITCAANICTLGSCCLDGVCFDDPFSNTQVQCEAQEGVYLGGVACTTNPCPACPFDFVANCQQVQTFVGPVPLIDRNPERNADTEEGTVAADDVKFAEGIVDEICWQIGHYIEPCCADCGDIDPDINDSWEIRIYATDPDCDGLPGEEIGFSTLTVLNRVQGTGQASNTWQYSGSLDASIVLTGTPGLGGDTYWFEVSAFGINGCGVRANWSRDNGNEHYVASQVAGVGLRDYGLAGVQEADLGFCENSGIATPGPVLGSCCTCPANCQENFTQRECGVIDGVWLACATCAESPCPDSPPNDTCNTPFLVSNVPESLDGLNVLLLTGFDNICADSDGPGLSDEMTAGCEPSLNSGTADMFNDVWYAYTATACGDLTIDGCGAADMDQMLAVYDATNDCPLTDSEEIACGDDTCGIGAGPATVTVRVLKDHEYLIRMGGWRANDGLTGDPRGSFDLEWGLTIGVCSPVDELERADPPHDIRKNRYISIDPTGINGTNPDNLQIRVMVDSTDVDGGLTGSGPWWASDPDEDCISIVTKAKPALAPDWSACPTVHLTGCPIVPATTYNINAEAEGELSPDSLLDTQAKPGVKWFGDCVGFFNGAFWTAPNGETSIDDAVAAIKTFQFPDRLPGCATPPCNATHTSVTDIVPNLVPGPQINKVVNIADVFAIIQGFQGAEFANKNVAGCE